MIAIPVLPVCAVVLCSIAYVQAGRRGKKYGTMTPDRQIVYDAALQTLKDPDKLRILADAFDKCGLKNEGELLRKRATLRTAAPEVKAARKEAYRNAMKTKDPKVARQLADVFEKEGATGAAASLRHMAQGLEALQEAV